MGVTLNTAMSSMAAYHNLRRAHGQLDGAMERLSSGFRINRAADDAAGLAISQGLRAQIGGAAVAQRNTRDGISMMQVADGALSETHSVLQRMRTLAVQAGNSGAMDPTALQGIQAEMQQLVGEIDRIAVSTSFNGIPLLDGSFHDKNLQVGANAADVMPVSIVSGIMPAVTARPAGVALWDVYRPENLSSLADQITVTQSIKDPATGASMTQDATVTLPIPKPASVSELVDTLNADPTFSTNFTASYGHHQFADGTTVNDANVIIMAKTPAAGPVSVVGVPSSTTQSDPGQDARPENHGGFHSYELLGHIDVTTQPSTTTTTVSSSGRGFGYANDVPSTSTVTSTTRSGASAALNSIDRAIRMVSAARGDIGSYQNTLEHTANALGVSAENLTASESRIRDADMALEMSTFSKAQILAQAGTAMLAQANQLPQTILKLIQ